MRKRMIVCTGVCILFGSMLLAMASVPSAQQKIVLNLWDQLDPRGTTPRQVARGKLWTGFEEEHPGIKLNVSIFPPHLMNTEIIKAAHTDANGDVIFIFNWYETMHVDAGSVVPLDEYASELYEKDWVIAWEKTGYYNGHKYFIPWDMRATVLYYRKDLFDEAGLTVPKTWKETAAAGTKLRTNERNGFVVGLSPGEFGTQFGETFASLLLGLGGKLFDEETNRPLFNSKESAKIFQTFYDMIYKHNAMSKVVLGYRYTNVQEAMQTGTTAMMTLGTHRLAIIRAGGLGEKVQTAPLPGFEGYSIPSMTVPMQWGLAMGANPPSDHRNPEYRDAIIELIKYAKSVEGELVMMEGGELPARQTTWGDPRLRERTSDFATRLGWKSYILEYGKDLYRPPKWADAQIYLAEAINKMILQNLPAEQVLDEAAERYISLLEE